MSIFGDARVAGLMDSPLVKLAVKLGARVVGRYKWAVVCGGCQLPIKREKWKGHRCD